MTNRPWWCGIYTCFRRPIRIFCGLPPVCRRAVGGGLLVCCLLLGRHIYRNYGIRSRKHSRFIPVHMLVAGETFQAHETFIQKLNMQIELCSAESSNVILVFCPVVSRIGTDMEAAMVRVTENKPVIVVFMHHCHDPSHMTNISMQPTDSKIVQVVHCVFLENQGLLGCQENEQAVGAVRSELKKYYRETQISTTK